MFRQALWGVVVGIVAGTLYPASARAEIYTWIDNAGVTNVSNLPPPEGARALNVTRAAPKDPVREAALREAAREAQMRALQEHVQQLQAEIEQSRREAPPSPAFVSQPPIQYSPAQPAPYVIVVSSPPPAYPEPASGCVYSWGNCGLGFWPGAYPASVVVVRDRHFRHGHAIRHARPIDHSVRNIPPAIHLPPPVRTGGHWRK
jgi:Domain of unknown function (DUF4124)